jgi:hypothetical protein
MPQLDSPLACSRTDHCAWLLAGNRWRVEVQLYQLVEPDFIKSFETHLEELVQDLDSMVHESFEEEDLSGVPDEVLEDLNKR